MAGIDFEPLEGLEADVSEVASVDSIDDISLEATSSRMGQNSELIAELVDMGFELAWANAALRHFAASGKSLSTCNKCDRLEAATTWLNEHNALSLSVAIEACDARMLEEACENAEMAGALHCDLQEARKKIVQCRQNELELACSSRCAEQVIWTCELARKAGVSGCILSAAKLVLVDIRRTDLLAAMEHLDQLDGAVEAYVLAAIVGVSWDVLEPAQVTLKRCCELDFMDTAARLNATKMSAAAARSSRMGLPRHVFDHVMHTCRNAFNHPRDQASKEKALMCMSDVGFSLSRCHKEFALMINFEKAILILKIKALPWQLRACVVNYFRRDHSEYFRFLHAEQVRAFRGSSETNLGKWIAFCREHGLSSDPASVDLASLRRFLASI